MSFLFTYPPSKACTREREAHTKTEGEKRERRENLSIIKTWAATKDHYDRLLVLRFKYRDSFFK
jgi:hypothetical protein